MATNLALDPDLLERAFAVSGEKTKKATKAGKKRTKAAQSSRTKKRSK